VGCSNPTSRSNSQTRSLRSLDVDGTCARRTSPTWFPTHMTGLSESAGCCETNEIFRPRIVLSSDSGKRSKSRPCQKTSPAPILACGGSNPRIACASVLFPHPDSPRIPRISLRRISRRMPFRARTSSPLDGQYVTLNPRIWRKLSPEVCNDDSSPMAKSYATLRAEQLSRKGQRSMDFRFTVAPYRWG
jgi:hypothetical protein